MPYHSAKSPGSMNMKDIEGMSEEYLRPVGPKRTYFITQKDERSHGVE